MQLEDVVGIPPKVSDPTLAVNGTPCQAEMSPSCNLYSLSRILHVIGYLQFIRVLVLIGKTLGTQQ